MSSVRLTTLLHILVHPLTILMPIPAEGAPGPEGPGPEGPDPAALPGQVASTQAPGLVEPAQVDSTQAQVQVLVLAQDLVN